MTWKDPSGHKGKTFDWIGVSTLRKLRRSPGREHSSPNVVSQAWTRAAQRFPSARRYGITSYRDTAQHHQMAKRLRSPEDGTYFA
jgi:hypothetical protein